MLDSPRLTIVARRVAPVVQDARPSEAVEDPIQRRDLILLERARDGSLDAFNDLVECYQDHLFALVARMVPDRDQAGDAVRQGAGLPAARPGDDEQGPIGVRHGGALRVIELFFPQKCRHEFSHVEA